MALYKCIYRQTHMPGGLGYMAPKSRQPKPHVRVDVTVKQRASSRIQDYFL